MTLVSDSIWLRREGNKLGFKTPPKKRCGSHENEKYDDDDDEDSRGL